MELPKSEASASSFTLKVAMGKRVYQSLGNGDCSVPLMSLRENLNVVIQNVEGKELFRTEFRTISIVEKGFIEDSFPLISGGYVCMKLQFLLSQEEHIRIRKMRESALKRKHGEQFKTGIGGWRNGNWITYSGEGALLDQSQKRDPGSNKSSGTSSLEVVEQPSKDSFERDVLQLIEGSTENVKVQSAANVINKPQISSKVGLDPQSEFLTSSISSRLKGKRIQSNDTGPRLKSSPSEVALKSMCLEESDIHKVKVPQTISKSFSSGMLSDISSQQNPKLFHSVFPKNQDHALEYKNERNIKNQGSDEFKVVNKTIGIRKISNSAKFIEHASEREGPVRSLKREFIANKETLNGRTISEEQNAMATPRNREELEAAGEGSSSKEMMDGINRNFEKSDANVLKTGEKDEERNFAKESQILKQMLDGSGRIDQLGGMSTDQHWSYLGEVIKEESESEFSRSQSNEEIVCATPSESAESLTYFDDERCALGYYGVWTTRHLCITTGTRQLRDLVSVCATHPVQGKPSIGTDDQEKWEDDSSTQVNEDERSSYKSVNPNRENSVGIPKPNGGLIEQGVRVAILLVACGTLLFNTRQRKLK